MSDDRPEDRDPAKSQQPRRRPPVLELEATEIGGGAADKRSRTAEPGPDDATRQNQNMWSTMLNRLSAFEWWIAPVVIAGAGGVVAGAAVVLLVVTLAGGGSDPRLDTLAGEVSSLSTRIETLARRPVAGGENSALGERIDQLAKVIADSERRIAALGRQPPQAESAELGSRTATIEATLEDMRKALADLRRIAEASPRDATPAAIDALAGRIGGLESRIAALAPPARESAPPALATEITALHALDGAIKSGKPFTKELTAARTALGERATPLTAFEPAAAEGLPTIAVLAQRFAELAPVLVREPDPEGSFVTRLLSNAVRLVEIRPAGEPEGRSIGAVVARMETKLHRGDLVGALDEVPALTVRARAAAADWIATANRRRDAEELIKNLTTAALAAPATERTRP